LKGVTLNAYEANK